jgi:hypothetical protein
MSVTNIYNPSFDEQRIIGRNLLSLDREFTIETMLTKFAENCKFLFGDVDPVVLTESAIIGGSYVFKACVIDRSYTSFFSASGPDSRARQQYSLCTSDPGYLVSGIRGNWEFSIQCAISNLHTTTARLVNQKMDQKSLKLKEIQEGVEEKLQRLTVDIEDSEVKEGLRLQLIDRARASIARKEEKRKTEVAKKIQDLLDTLEDEEDDDGDLAMERLLLQVQQPSTNPKSSAEVDWRGECVFNILRDCQKKFREKLREQKEDLTAKLEAAKQDMVDSMNAERAIADAEKEDLTAKLEAEKQGTVDSMNAERAIADAEKEAVIRDLKEKLDAKGQALEKACTNANREKGFRQKLEDALDVLRHTEDERKQDLIRIKIESERRREKIVSLQQQYGVGTTGGEVCIAEITILLKNGY